MYLTHLSLTNFRSFARLDMDVPRRNLLLVGDNAQGKTSLLESVYYLATFTSLQASSDRQLINFLAAGEELSVARLVADFHRQERDHRLEIRLILEPLSTGNNRLRKEILLDGVKRSIQESIGSFNAVMLLPQMTRILEGGPEERRRYLNLALAQVTPGYAQALSEYTQVLGQRNALLKLLADRGGDVDQLLYWDTLLTQKGALLIEARVQAIADLEELAARFHERLTNNREILQLLYKPSFDPARPQTGQFSLPIEAGIKAAGLTREDIRSSFQAQLAARRREEIARGVTVIGPHRDDLCFLSNQVDLGIYGSRGQIRTTLLALKLAEVEWMRAKTGEWPVLLLDETLAELDVQRRADLLRVLEESEQSLLTTTDLGQFADDFVRQSTTWQISAGVVACGEPSA